MLRKLFKYEVLATGRVFLPLYAALLAVALINKVLLSPDEFQLPQGISMFVYIMLLAGMFVMTMVVMIQRFYKNLLSDEGYLMFTLPARSWKHIVSKLVTSMLWIAASGIAALLSIIIVAYEHIFSPLNLRLITDGVVKLFEIVGAQSGLFLIEFLLISIIGLAANVLIIYASMALGHLFNRHRILASIGAFIVLNTASQMLVGMIGSILSFADFPGHIIRQFDLYTAMPFIHGAAWSLIIFIGLLSTGYFFITNYVLSKHLNLE